MKNIRTLINIQHFRGVPFGELYISYPASMNAIFLLSLTPVLDIRKNMDDDINNEASRI